MHHRLLLRPPLPNRSPALSLGIQPTHIGYTGIRSRVDGGSEVVARDNKIRPPTFFTSFHDPLSSLLRLADTLTSP